jgi:hypothetical protein
MSDEKTVVVLKGRPCKLTKEAAEKLCMAIAEGLSYEQACRKVGISRTTFHTWRRRGKEATSGPFWAFLNRLREAEAVALMRLEDALMMAATGGYEQVEKKQIFKNGKLIEESVTTKVAAPNGSLLLQILERRDPSRWAPRRQPLLEITDDPLEVRLFGNVGFGIGNEGFNPED